MQNYKALKAASKVSVQKVEVVDREKVDAVSEVKYKKGDDIPEGKKVGDIKVERVVGRPKISHEELVVVSKRYNPNTGEALDDISKSYTLSSVELEINMCKKQIEKMQAEQSEWEELEKDLKAL
jgi:mRNA degradation ribonuclease J1/J2